MSQKEATLKATIMHLQKEMTEACRTAARYTIENTELKRENQCLEDRIACLTGSD